MALFNVKPSQGNEQNQVGQTFVNLCGMLGHHLSAVFKDKAPGQGSVHPVNFRIHKIPHPDKEGRQLYGDHQPVQQPGKTLAADLFLIVVQSDEDTNGATMACQSPLPDIQYLYQVF